MSDTCLISDGRTRLGYAALLLGRGGETERRVTRHLTIGITGDNQRLAAGPLLVSVDGPQGFGYLG
jgi:hypothetical protein